MKKWLLSIICMLCVGSSVLAMGTDLSVDMQLLVDVLTNLESKIDEALGELPPPTMGYIVEFKVVIPDSIKTLLLAMQDELKNADSAIEIQSLDDLSYVVMSVSIPNDDIVLKQVEDIVTRELEKNQYMFLYANSLRYETTKKVVALPVYIQLSKDSIFDADTIKDALLEVVDAPESINYVVIQPIVLARDISDPAIISDVLNQFSQDQMLAAHDIPGMIPSILMNVLDVASNTPVGSADKKVWESTTITPPYDIKTMYNIRLSMDVPEDLSEYISEIQGAIHDADDEAEPLPIIASQPISSIWVEKGKEQDAIKALKDYLKSNDSLYVSIDKAPIYDSENKTVVLRFGIADKQAIEKQNIIDVLKPVDANVFWLDSDMTIAADVNNDIQEALAKAFVSKNISIPRISVEVFDGFDKPVAPAADLWTKKVSPPPATEYYHVMVNAIFGDDAKKAAQEIAKSLGAPELDDDQLVYPVVKISKIDESICNNETCEQIQEALTKAFADNKQIYVRFDKLTPNPVDSSVILSMKLVDQEKSSFDANALEAQMPDASKFKFEWELPTTTLDINGAQKNNLPKVPASHFTISQLLMDVAGSDNVVESKNEGIALWTEAPEPAVPVESGEKLVTYAIKLPQDLNEEFNKVHEKLIDLKINEDAGEVVYPINPAYPFMTLMIEEKAVKDVNEQVKNALEPLVKKVYANHINPAFNADIMTANVELELLNKDDQNLTESDLASFKDVYQKYIYGTGISLTIGIPLAKVKFQTNIDAINHDIAPYSTDVLEGRYDVHEVLYVISDKDGENPSSPVTLWSN